MTTRPLRLALLGHPVHHSLSPPMHEAALVAVGLSGTYGLRDVREADLDGCLDALRRGEVDGYNVTVPHKQAALRLCDEPTPEAAALGAVNTLWRMPDGRVGGANTDLPGLVDAVRARWREAAWVGRPAVVIGAGGAARAAILAATRLGCSEVRVANRTVARAARVVAELAAPAVVAPFEPASASGAALLFQATTLGMATTPHDPAWTVARDQAAAWVAHLAPDAVVVDLVYRPRLTPWVGAAQDRGLDADDGLEMLLRQAARAFGIWTGRRPPLDVMREALTTALGR